MSNLPQINPDDLKNLAFGQRLKDTSKDTDTYRVARNTGELDYLNDAQKSIFLALAGKNGNAILDQDEVDDLQSSIGDKANDGELSKKEVQQILNELVSKGYENLKNVSWKDFHGFLYQLVAQSKNMTSSQGKVTTTNNNGEETVTEGYCISSNLVVKKDGNGNVVEVHSVVDQYYDNEGNLLAKEVRSNGDKPLNEEPTYTAQYNDEDKVVYKKQIKNGETLEYEVSRATGENVYTPTNKPPMGLEKTPVPQPAPQPAQPAENPEATAKQAPAKSEKAEQKKPAKTKTKKSSNKSEQETKIPHKYRKAPKINIPEEGYTKPVTANAGKTITDKKDNKITYDHSGFVSQIVNKKGQVIQKIAYYGTFSTCYENYEYDNHGRVVKITSFYNDELSACDVDTYSYDNNGGATKTSYNYIYDDIPTVEQEYIEDLSLIMPLAEDINLNGASEPNGAIAQTAHGVYLHDITSSEALKGVDAFEEKLSGEGFTTPSTHKGETITSKRNKITYDNNGYITKIVSKGVTTTYERYGNTIFMDGKGTHTVYQLENDKFLFAEAESDGERYGYFYKYNLNGNITGIHSIVTKSDVTTFVYYTPEGKVKYYTEIPEVNGEMQFDQKKKFNIDGTEIE